MRAVMVLELPETPDDDERPLQEMMTTVAKAIGALDLKDARLMVTIREAADAVLAAAEPGTGGRD